MSKTCTSCRNLVGCTRPQRKENIACREYSEIKIVGKRAAYLDSLFAFNEAMEEDPRTNRAEMSSEIILPEEDEFVAIIDSVLGENSMVPRDIRVDDRDLKEFPNFFSYVHDKRGAGVTPFPRQLWIATKLFAEYCADCSEPEFFDDILNCPVRMPSIADFQDHAQLLHHGVCPKCKKTRLDLIRQRKLNPYNELVLCLGQRSGKSILTSILDSYVTHRLLKSQKPTEIYGLLPNTTLSSIYVGLTFKGAVELLWNPVRELLQLSPWFQSYHSMLDDTGSRLGQELYAFKDTFINYKHRKLLSFPSGPNKRTLRGRTTVKAAIDELGWFKADDGAEEQEKQSAKEVYIALDRTLKTVRTAAVKAWKAGYYDVPMAYGFYLSSPSSAFDMIMTLIKSNYGSRTTLAVQMPTWGINPNYTKKDFAKEYRDDPVKAERDYGANPPLGDNQFIENEAAVLPSFKPKKNRVVYRYVTKTPDTGKVRIIAALNSTNTINPTPRSLMSIDAGEVNNSFVCTIGHHVESKDPGVVNTVTDAIIEIIPEFGIHKISFNGVFKKIIIPLLKTFNIGAVVADRWQSSLLLDTLREEHNVHTEVYSLKRTDFDTVKSYLEGGKISNPELEWDVKKILDPNKENYPKCFDFAPVSHLLFQMMTVSDNGRTITKGTGLTDDIFRAWNLLHVKLLDPKFREEHLKAPAVQQKGLYGVIAMPSGGGSNIKSSVIASSTGGVSSSGNMRVFASSPR